MLKQFNTNRMHDERKKRFSIQIANSRTFLEYAGITISNKKNRVLSSAYLNIVVCGWREKKNSKYIKMRINIGSDYLLTHILLTHVFVTITIVISWNYFIREWLRLSLFLSGSLTLCIPHQHIKFILINVTCSWSECQIWEKKCWNKWDRSVTVTNNRFDCVCERGWWFWFLKILPIFLHATL